MPAEGWKAEWIADLRSMVDYLDEHPELIASWEYVMLRVPDPEALAEEEAILAHMINEDNSGDPARIFGAHHIYVSKAATTKGIVEGLQRIAEETR
jgi:hypothetical protein